MSSLAAPRARIEPPVAADVLTPRYGLGFALFVVLNAMLFVRPAEIVPALLGWEIYQVCILACLLTSFPVLLEQFQPSNLEARPLTVCVLGLLLAVVLSHLTAFRFSETTLLGWDFFKTVLYFLLFVGLVNTPSRLRWMLWWLLLFASVVALLAVLQYHGVITLPNLTPLKELGEDKLTGASTVAVRLRGSGIFQDPNDLSILLVVSVVLALYWITDRASGPLRVAWIGSLLLCLYALSLTQSRGGLLALLAALFLVLRMRYGWRMALVLGAGLVPVMLVFFAGRQTDLSTSHGTGQDRIQLWSEGLLQFRHAPLFGIGRDEFDKAAGLVAHNSYVHTFAELGFLGGMFFIGAFVVALESLYRLGTDGRRILDPDLRRLHPYLTGVVGGYAISMMSLTLCYIIPTYTILALAGVYLRMTATTPATPAARFDARLLMRLVGIGILAIIGLYVFLRLFTVSG
jgi:O-antigen ligase